MASITRSSVLSTLVVVILIATLPGAIRRIVQTGDLYLFTRRFFDDMLARLSGAGRIRFLLQPTVAILLGFRDGRKDARMGLPPFLGPLHSMASIGASFCEVSLHPYANSLPSQSFWTSFRNS
jgi:hypothetical protein